ncbi:TerC family protein [Pseudomonas sp. RTC3]|uniref:TerC family protein n=1 Tax=unclassified Pseudomonas TaxID=196821 RepID=UPI002AB3B885|nr:MULTISPECIES: TerC family protein [unclassified Pseudomonas]MEB0064800.1 TerC family protein [Pseudomonas sp. RTC3]MDY7568084.1 TerC family protein [Pseudomonas sp. 5C2]MEB0005136.1 TerC family protein [Pseudomonas sp. RTB2]MEB0019061.1 TerC family protein [Pseudomonas sp. RTB3]MEB0024205.1 TerC family protein [Pseudomonas sp. MH9.2]
MMFEGLLHAIGMIFQISLLDLILSGDNALVIALACRGLPANQVKQAVMIGTGGAIVLRVLLTTLAGWLLLAPFLKLIGAGLLIVIAIRLLIEEQPDDESDSVENTPTTLFGAVTTVLVADLVMSMDNVVGLAAVAQGSIFYLVLGLLLSVPLLMFGSVQITRLLHRQPFLVSVGGALLGYVAGDIAVSDPAVVGWVNTQSPALNTMVPLLCAAFVVLQARIIHRQRATVAKPAPKLRRAPPASESIAASVVAEVARDSVLIVAVDALTERASVGATSSAESSATAPSTGGAEWVLASVNPVQDKPEAAAVARSVPAEVPDRGRRVFGGRVQILVGLGAISLVSWVLYSFIGSIAGGLLPRPVADSAYVCPGAIATVYYRPGGSAIRIVTGNGEAAGYVSLKKILWENPAAAVSALHLTPPSEIEKTNSNVVTLSGGSFSQIQCARVH